MKLANTPGIRLKDFFTLGCKQEDAEFEIKSSDDFINILFEGYEWALIRSYNCAKRYADKEDVDARLDTIWFDAQARVFENLLIAIQKNGTRTYDKEWLWMLRGRPYYHNSEIAQLNAPIDNRFYGAQAELL